MTIEKIAPTAVAERGRFFRRADDVREEHRFQNAVRLRDLADTSVRDFLDLLRGSTSTSLSHGKVSYSGQFDEPRAPGIRSAIYRLATQYRIVKSRTL